MWKDAVAVENSLAVLETVKPRITICPKYSTFTYAPKRIENRYSNEYLYMNIHSSTYIAVDIGQKVETTPVYFHWWMANQKAIYPYNGY